MDKEICCDDMKIIENAVTFTGEGSDTLLGFNRLYLYNKKNPNQKWQSVINYCPFCGKKIKN